MRTNTCVNCGAEDGDPCAIDCMTAPDEQITDETFNPSSLECEDCQNKACLTGIVCPN